MVKNKMSLFNNKELSDIIFVYNDNKVFLHQAILFNRSNTLKNKIKLNDKNEYEICQDFYKIDMFLISYIYNVHDNIFKFFRNHFNINANDNIIKIAQTYANALIQTYNRNKFYEFDKVNNIIVDELYSIKYVPDLSIFMESDDIIKRISVHYLVDFFGYYLCEYSWGIRNENDNIWRYSFRSDNYMYFNEKKLKNLFFGMDDVLVQVLKELLSLETYIPNCDRLISYGTKIAKLAKCMPIQRKGFMWYINKQYYMLYKETPYKGHFAFCDKVYGYKMPPYIIYEIARIMGYDDILLLIDYSKIQKCFIPKIQNEIKNQQILKHINATLMHIN